MDKDYEQLRQSFRPDNIDWLFVAESPPPEAAKVSTRHFYRQSTGEGDRLFANTMKAIYPDAAELSEAELEQDKAAWLDRFKDDGCYMIEAVPSSIPHGVKTSERRAAIKAALPGLIERVSALVGPATQLILIKSNTFDVTAGPLRAAGFTVLNEALLDYPGRWREDQYRQKLSAMMRAAGWSK